LWMLPCAQNVYLTSNGNTICQWG